MKVGYERTDAFKLSGWRRLFGVPWTGRRSNQSLCCRKGDPFRGSKLGSCLTLRNELSEETHVLTKQETLLGKGARVESSRVREPRRTALQEACSLGFYGDGISFWVVFRQPF